MTVENFYPNVMGWIAGAADSHPLAALVEPVRQSGSSSSSGAAILGAFDQVIAALTAAAPARLATEKADFRKAKTWDDLLIVRSELIAGAKLAARGVEFDFGARGGSPQPDLVLRNLSLGIEVKARRLNGLQDLHDELEDALETAGAEVVVHIECRERPLYLKEAQRRDLVSQVLDRVADRSYRTVAVELDQPWAATPRLPLALRILPVRPSMPGQRVFIEGGEALSGHLADIESEVIAVLTADDQKAGQAASMPAILLVDLARTGMAWIRPERVWAQMLAAKLPQSTPFAGAAVMVPRLANAGVEIAMASRPDASQADKTSLRSLAEQLGLAAWGDAWYG